MQGNPATVSSAITERATQLGDALTARGWMLVTAESCTGGGIAAAVTDIAGSSGWFERGFVTYSNAAKQELLGVPAGLLEQHGAVSEAVAVAMAEGALAVTPGDVSVAVTGIAGPDGGTAEKPVGTVWFGWAQRTADGDIRTVTRRECFPGDRAGIRAATVLAALDGVMQLID